LKNKTAQSANLALEKFIPGRGGGRGRWGLRGRWGRGRRRGARVRGRRSSRM